LAAEAKAHARIDYSDDDDLLTAYLLAACGTIEAWTGRVIQSRTATLRLPRFPTHDDQAIELPGGNVSAVASVAYTDANGDAATLSSSLWTIETSSRGPAALRLIYGETWPAVQERGLPVVITYTAGWAADAIPAALEHAVKLMVAEMHERREIAVIGASVSMAPFAVQALISAWRLRGAA
jgi:uncharacterized phiE125 gp8 family phage protein